MPQIREKAKQSFNKLLGRETPHNQPSSNLPAGNSSRNSLSDSTGKNKKDEVSASSRAVTPLNQPSREPASESATTNPTTRDTAEEQIATATMDANIIFTPPEDSTQPFTNPRTDGEIRSLWKRALDSSDLSTKERQILQEVQGLLEPPNKTTDESVALGNFITDVLGTRQDKDWKFNFRGVDIGMKDVGRKIISLLDKFKQIGDIIMQYDPVHVALPWAGFRFLLKICVDKQKRVEAILIGLEKMTFLIDQCALYELLYLNLDTEVSKQLEKHMLRLYTAILRFLANAINRLQDNHIQAVFTTDEVSDNLRKVEEIAKAVEKYAQAAETQNTRAEFEGLKKLLRELNETNRSLQPQLAAIQQFLDQSRRSEILRWISEIPYTEHHSRISSERLSGTGNWVFNRQEYSDWSHSNTSKLLLLGGIPGAGKTYTASTVIDSFLKTTERFAYFYCNRAEEDRRDPQKILATIIQQLSQGSTDGLLTPVVKIYEDRERKGQTSAKLSLGESQDLLVQFADLYPNQETTICIDAMDEVNNETRIALLKALNDVITRAKSVIKIFITTRMDRDIVKQFKKFPLIELQPNDNATDINDFIAIKVHSLLEEKDWLDEDVENKLRSEICGTLQTRCKGNFQLASLQIEFLRRLQIKEDIRGELQKLPDTLAKTYQEIYANIRSQPGKSALLALNAFRWIQCSHWQLKSEELLNVVNAQVDSKGEFGTISERVETETLLAVCQNLVILDKSLNVFRFAHLSVDEYLETKLPREDSHLEIASICLSMLCTNDEAFKTENFLHNYSHVCWPWHFSECGLINRGGHLLGHLWDKFSTADPVLGDNTHISRWVRHYSECLKVVGMPWSYKSGSFYLRSKDFERCSTTITANEYTLACVFIFVLHQVLPALIETNAGTGLSQSTLDVVLLTSTRHGDLEIAQLLIDKGASVFATNEIRYTSLHQASKNGHKEVAQLLIDKGANVSATGFGGYTPLHEASSGGYKEVAQLLIDKGANVSATLSYGDTPLHEASSGGYKEVAQLLIEKGANVSATGLYGYTPLHRALERGHKEVALLLIKKGANPSATSKERYTPLHFASMGGHKEVAQLLIEKGASVFATDTYGYTPLHFSSRYGHREVAMLLIDKGASVFASDKRGYTSLHKASSRGRREVAQLLIDKGASVSATNKFGDTPLHEASSRGHKEVAQLLIDKGANVSATDEHGRTPLHDASLGGHKEVAQLLIDKGASVFATANYGYTPLHFSSRYGHREVAVLLIDNGGSVSDNDQYGDTPLHGASSGGHKEVAQLLIEKGADVSACNGNGDTPLHQASWEGHMVVAQLLIDKGANLSTTNENGDTPLHQASSGGSKVVTQLLIDKGVDVSASNGNGDTPLHQALRAARWEVARLLIDKGASASASNGKGNTPLHLVFRFGPTDVAQMLIEKGANVSATNQDGDTPLHQVSLRGHEEVAQLLIDKGASVSTTNADGNTALHFATLAGRKAVAQLLIDKGASVSPTGKHGDTPLHLASSNGHKEVVQLLIDKGANVSPTKEDGDTPLHQASLRGHEGVAQLLIDKGASVSTTNGNGDTPLHQASSGGHKGVTRLLIDKGANVSATNGNGDTPLHRASPGGHNVVAQLLIDKGANVWAKNSNGDTPFDLATREGYDDIAEMLMNLGATTSHLSTSSNHTRRYRH